MEESTTAYDAASNVIKSTSKQRYDNEVDTETGALGNPTIEPKARITYAGAYPDAIGRTQAAVNVGTKPTNTIGRDKPSSSKIRL